MAYRYYSQKDKQTILLYINKYPTNLAYAFEKAANKLDRSAKGISQYYYRTLRSGLETHITCGSKRGFSKNVKTSPRRVTKTNPNGEVKQQLSLLKDLWKTFRNHW